MNSGYHREDPFVPLRVTRDDSFVKSICASPGRSLFRGQDSVIPNPAERDEGIPLVVNEFMWRDF
jgi:hypothetical protein